MDGIRKVVPDFNFTTDIITGFPQETDEEFQDSVRSVDELFFTHVHTFKYSVRKGTRAERFNGHISEKVKNERSESIRLISEKNKEAYRKSFVNKPQRVLIEKERRHYVQGYGQHYVPVRIYDSALKRNTFADVIITGYEMIDQEIILTGEKV
jgi:threonylcarbamoyladenosine tRNA methylthiotransferase MtaB